MSEFWQSARLFVPSSSRRRDFVEEDFDILYFHCFTLSSWGHPFTRVNFSLALSKAMCSFFPVFVSLPYIFGEYFLRYTGFISILLGERIYDEYSARSSARLLKLFDTCSLLSHGSAARQQPGSKSAA
jgi:hypothetical protein